MPSATEARLVPVPRDGLPAWCDRHLSGGEFFASRLWYDMLIGHALPPGAEPLLAVSGDEALVLPLLRLPDGRLRALATPYSLDWRPLPAPSADTATLRAAARGIGRLLRWRPATRLDTLDPAAPGLEAVLAGFASAGLAPLRYAHFGNWHDTLPDDMGWEGYLAARPPALRTTIRRKVERCAREMRFDPVTTPGSALEAGIAGYEEARARSWKPHEPFPDFDAALLRAAAAAGVLRLGVLRDRGDGRAAAAQYWVLDRGGRRASLLKLAHAEDRRAASPGTALTALMLRRLIEEDGVRELDFGNGDDAYKQLWVGQRRGRIGVALADPRHPAALLEIARHLVGRARARLRGGR